ncbi:IPT/TIG domain-containing protein [Hydrogenophaga sp.]|uniref:IPT/TIG domain-containing protein n=1 Tax=Hydrogenophaga sp. TaxID=1904254 RepID=UPI0025C6D45C|nr:IPT/TIG domain-containing protein [Hydrogenophaga sp.]
MNLFLTWEPACAEGGKRLMQALVAASALVVLVACGGGGESAINLTPEVGQPGPALGLPAAPATVPTITGFAPASVAAGSQVVITGTNLDRVTSVRLGGVNAPSITVRSATRIDVLVPSGALSGAIEVSGASGAAQSGTPLTILQVVTVSRVVPTSVVTGGELTLSGTQLDRIRRVTLGGVTLPPVGVANATSLRVAVPVGASSGNLTVVDVNDVAQVLPQAITVLTPVVIAGFSPSAALVGGQVFLSGQGLDRVSTVLFSGTSTAATITARSASALTVTVPVGAATGAITLQYGVGESLRSSAEFTVIPRIEVDSAAVFTVSAAGNPVTLTGRGLTEVSGVLVGGNPVNISGRSAIQIVFPAPAGVACAAIALTSSSQPGVAAGNLVVGSGCVNPVQISGIEFAQVQSQAANANYQRLNPGQETWVRAYVNAPTAGRLAPSVRLRGLNGTTTLGTLDMTGPATLPQVPTGQTPSDSQRYSLTHTFRVQLPTAWVDPGLRVRVEVDPSNALGAQTSQEATPVVGSATRLTVVIVPLVSGSNQPTLPSQAQVLNELARTLPLARNEITVNFRAPYTLTSVTDGVDTNDEWSNALFELDQLRRREAPNALYYGLVRPMVNAGIAGIGYVNSQTSRSPNLSSLGWDASRNSWSRTMVHELGHNFSRRHTACGNTASPDAAYPYANGAMPPVPLFDSNTRTIVAPGAGSTQADVMGYCSGSWFSDYNYSFVQGFLEAQRGAGNIGLFESAAAEISLLMISGSIEGNSARIDKVLPSRGQVPAVEETTHEVEVTTTDGRTVRVGVIATEVDHADPPAQHFTGVLPDPGRIAKIAVLSGGRAIGERNATLPKARAASASPRDNMPWANRSVTGASTLFTWNASLYPLATIEHVLPNSQRSVLALQARGGQAQLGTAHLPAGGVFEIGLSDGLNVQTLTLPR